MFIMKCSGFICFAWVCISLMSYGCSCFRNSYQPLQDVAARWARYIIGKPPSRPGAEKKCWSPRLGTVPPHIKVNITLPNATATLCYGCVIRSEGTTVTMKPHECVSRFHTKRCPETPRKRGLCGKNTKCVKNVRWWTRPHGRTKPACCSESTTELVTTTTTKTTPMTTQSTTPYIIQKIIKICPADVYRWCGHTRKCAKKKTSKKTCATKSTHRGQNQTMTTAQHKEPGQINITANHKGQKQTNKISIGPKMILRAIRPPIITQCACSCNEEGPPANENGYWTPKFENLLRKMLI